VFDKEQGSFVPVDNGPSVFLEKPGDSFPQVQQEQRSGYLSDYEELWDHSGDTGYLAFRRGDTIEVPPPNSKDTMVVPLLHSQNIRVGIHFLCAPFPHDVF
jgi:hypothetical protein